MKFAEYVLGVDWIAVQQRKIIDFIYHLHRVRTFSLTATQLFPPNRLLSFSGGYIQSKRREEEKPLMTPADSDCRTIFDRNVCIKSKKCDGCGEQNGVWSAMEYEMLWWDYKEKYESYAIKLGIVQRCHWLCWSRPRLKFYRSVPAIKTHLRSWETVPHGTLSSKLCCDSVPMTFKFIASHWVRTMEGIVCHIVCSYIAKPLHTSVCSPVGWVRRGCVFLDDGKRGSSITALY